MGRCNNRRTQQQAQALQNTPARARFSNKPPQRRNNNKNKTNNINNGDDPQQQQQQTKKQVVSKIANRVGQQQPASSSASQTSSSLNTPFRGIDLSKLDEIKLSEESIQLAYRLLTNLNIVQQPARHKKQSEVYHAEEEAFLDNNDELSALPPRFYSEYDDDVLEDEEEEYGLVYNHTSNKNIHTRGLQQESYHDHPGDTDWEGQQVSVRESAAAVLDDDEVNKEVDVEDTLEKDFVFLHLTRQLSFSTVSAARACRALETWQGAAQQGTGSAPAASSREESRHRVGLALDWLSLHLTETELKSGLKNQPRARGSWNGGISSGLQQRPLPSLIKTIPIPHPSISVATKLTDDTAFLQKARLEERAVGFLQLGFSYSDTIKVLEEEETLKQTTITTNVEADMDAIQDGETLQLLLTMLEQETLHQQGGGGSGGGTLLAAEDATVLAAAHQDKDVTQEEREQEKEVLEAVYDQDFEVLYDESGREGGCDRYKICIRVNDKDEEDVVSELHVFLRPGYPTSQPPLFLFCHAHYAPPLLRRVNMELVRQAHNNAAFLGGGPSIFETVTFLSENLEVIRNDFQKEMRSHEFEAVQIRMRKKAGHNIATDNDDFFYDDKKSLSRRQRARLKGLEKAFDREEKEAQEEKERRLRQQERLQRIKQEDRTVREKMAARAIEKREKELHEDGMRQAYRSAMSASLNRGQSVEEARAAADQARRDYCSEHGLQVSSSDDEQDAKKDDEKVTPTSPSNEEALDSEATSKPQSSSTPTTTAFMHRLRQMYTAAQQKKSNFHLCEARSTNGIHRDEADEDEQSSSDDHRVKLPCPVAAPVGDLADIMKDVVTIQTEQPWLVSAEARVPVVGVAPDEEATGASAQTFDQNEKQKEISKQLKRELEQRCELTKTSKSLGAIFEQRSRLPAYQMRSDILTTIANNQVTVVSADTGAGKTTQVPQLVLDDCIRRNVGASANIIVTNPRRISAISVAERIASERGERVGGTCGYSIKLEKKTSRKTRLLLCTTGVLLRRLQIDPDLAAVSHVFVDEVHERDLNTDFLLIILKDLLKRRKTLKLVLMSATLNADAFAGFFDGCAVVSIPGRAHPVQEFRLEDVLQITGYEVQEGSDYATKQQGMRQWSKSALRKRYYGKYNSKVISSLSIVDESIINYELIALLLQHIDQTGDEGAILVFLPGLMEIVKAIDETKKIELFQSPSYAIFPLHSSLPTTEQKVVFEVPPKGVRKIIFSTNITETAVTIEDVVFVVDTGRVKENQRDEIKETPALVECWVSRSSSKQRRGRAGRVRPGIAYHLFSSHMHDETLQDYQLPEMLRVGLEDLTLQILTLDLGEPSVFLSKALNPPSALAMRNSLKLLESLGAVECHWQGGVKRSVDSNDELDDCSKLPVSTELTALGFHLASLPVEPRVGKMLLYGAIFGCVEPALTIAASMTSSKPLFVSPLDQRDAAREARLHLATNGSDHLTMLSVFDQWKSLRRRKGDRDVQTFIRENFLSRMTLFQMEELRRHYGDLLLSSGFLPREYRLSRNDGDPSGANANSRNVALLKAILCAGLYPNVVVAPRSLVDGSAKQEAGEVGFRSNTKGDVYLHPCTISFSSKSMDSRYCCFHEIVKTSKMYIRDCTTVSPVSLLLFGGAIQIYHGEGVVTVDEWLQFRIAAKSAVLISHLRVQMEKVLLQKILAPEVDVAESRVGRDLIDSVTVLLAREKPTTKSSTIDDGAEIVRPYIITEASRRAGGRGRLQQHSGRGRGRRSQRGGGRG